jgi:UDP-N-acetylmuramoyl-tripeptide--D-alanyl-D-alanine ligase
MLISNENILEHHNLKNLAGTTIFCLSLFPDYFSKIIKAASAYKQPEMNRSQWVENIFLDAYNANPSSMKVSLESFVNIMKSKNINLDDCYFVLGDMNELGDFSREMHIDIARLALNIGIKNITFIGRFKKFYTEGYPNSTSSYLTKDEFTEDWKKIRKQYKYIFVKASRSLQLETLMTIL